MLQHKDNKEHKDNSPIIHSTLCLTQKNGVLINYLWPRNFLVPAPFAHGACTFSTIQVDTTPPDVLKGCGSDLSNMLMSIIILCAWSFASSVQCIQVDYRHICNWLPWQPLWSSIEPTGLPMPPIKSGKDVKFSELVQIDMADEKTNATELSWSCWMVYCTEFLTEISETSGPQVSSYTMPLASYPGHAMLKTMGWPGYEVTVPSLLSQP